MQGEAFQRRFAKHLSALERKSHLQLDEDKIPFPVGTKVCISMSKSGFAKGTAATYSTEVNTIARVRDTRPIRMYVLKDSIGDDITSSFYPWEIQKAEETFPKHR